MKTGSFAIVLLLTIVASSAHATKCGEYIYNKQGLLRKYEYLPLDISESTKKHGSMSSSWGASTESSTASSDPGVTTGQWNSSSQAVSSYGDCKLPMPWASRVEFQRYIAQNLNEIKREMALGKGGHLEMLATGFGCHGAGKDVFQKAAQRNLDKFVDFTADQAGGFAASLDEMVTQDASIASLCTLG